MNDTISVHELSPDYCLPKTWSVKFLHVGMVSDLSMRLGMNESAIVRAAIENYYKQHQSDLPPADDR